jgi:CDP-glucose 4,6-dehydratase
MNLLHAARLAPSLQAIVVVTSDKVYRHQYGGAVAFREGDELGGDDPYSGSKALAELIVQACRETCLANSGVSIATARAGNVIGGGDRGQDRLLPDAWRAIEANETLLVRNPHAVRPWQFVLEPLHGYMLLAERLATRPADVPAAINFGPDAGSTETVAGLLDRLFALWGPGDWRVDASSRLTEAECLRLDSSLARHTLGWRPRLSLDEALEWTMEWWRKSLCSDNLYELAIRQLHAYEALLP